MAEKQQKTVQVNLDGSTVSSVQSNLDDVEVYVHQANPTTSNMSESEIKEACNSGEFVKLPEDGSIHRVQKFDKTDAIDNEFLENLRKFKVDDPSELQVPIQMNDSDLPAPPPTPPHPSEYAATG